MNELHKAAVSCTAAVLLTLFLFTAAAADGTKDSKTVKNSFTPAAISIAVRESADEGEEDEDFTNSDSSLGKELEWSESGDGYTAVKLVKVANLDESEKNNTSAYIRVCIMPKWVTTVLDTKTVVTNIEGLEEFGSYPDDISGESFEMGGITFTLEDNWRENWIYSGGYFYCKDSIEPAEETPILLKSVGISADYLAETEALGVSLEVDVIADSIQTEGMAVETRWADSGVEIGGDGKLEGKTQADETDVDGTEEKEK